MGRIEQNTDMANVADTAVVKGAAFRNGPGPRPMLF